MGEYVELPGVRTWYDTDGPDDAAETLVLLHGGFCTNETWDGQRPDFAAKYRLFLPERRAHGRTPDVAGPLNYQDMANDTVDFLESVVRGPAHLVGWSDGGIVALLVAMARPDLVRKVVAIGVNYRPLPDVEAKPDDADESASSDDSELDFLQEIYEAVSPDGPEHWPVVVDKVLHMFGTQPDIAREDLGRITAPTLVMASDDDLMSLEHTIDLYRALPDSELAIVPGTSHTLPLEKPAVVNRTILDFLGGEPVKTIMPVRRAWQGS
ncbi:alpha/beta fold hydrolase [Streptomyces sp. NPDC008150]|uniref:alpha/beta fold hydrolase n=1 Tax=Streptomyces sp. NPDC008150 TaxID=3364816 RepID=UPI0036E98030